MGEVVEHVRQRDGGGDGVGVRVVVGEDERLAVPLRVLDQAIELHPLRVAGLGVQHRHARRALERGVADP
jgi:hypothetical protein